MSWETVKLGKVLHRRRETLRLNPDTDYQLVTIKLYHKGVVLREIVKGSSVKSPMSAIKAGDFILSGIDARNGAFGIVPSELEGAVITNDFWCLDVDEQLMDKQFFLFLTSTPFFDFICKQSSDGTTQRIRLQKEKFFNYEITLPSIEEQKKIHALLQQSKDSYEALANEFANQLTLLKKLRRSLLQDAVQGKLVAQDANDEPAMVLFQKIKAEKEALVVAKKLKKDKPLPPIEGEEIPFVVPEGWVWCRGEIVADFIDPQPSHRTPIEVSDGIAYVAMSDINDSGNIVFNSARKVDITVLEEHRNRYALQDGDFIFGKIGTIGKPVWLPKPFNYTLSANIILIQPKRALIREKYLFYFLTSPIADKILRDKKSTTSYPVFGMGKARNMTIPLPPLPEQRRIVQKLESLVASCGTLEKSIKSSQHQATQLLQTALREALQEQPNASAATEATAYATEAESPKPIIIPDAKKSFARQAMAGKIISLFHTDRHFTHIKFQKLQYLAEQLALVDVGQSYYMQAAGPHDNVFMHSMPVRLQRSKWFEERAYRFYPMEKAGEIDRYYDNYFGSARDRLNDLFGLLKNATEEQSEMVATLYAVWNDRIIRKEAVSDELSIEDFYKWSERKLRYTEEALRKCLAWMREHNIVPVGFGSPTKIAKSRTK